jgi:hypothetical protein
MADTKPTRSQNLSAAYGAASNRLKEAHLDEWNGYMREETVKRGEKWSPKPTAEEKAEAELQALLKAHPHLAEKVAVQPTVPAAK